LEEKEMKKTMRALLSAIVCVCFLAFVLGPAAMAQQKAPAEVKVQAEKATKAAKPKPVPDEKVKAIQEALNKAGAKLKVDGIMGPKTKAALEKFQKKHGLKVTGEPDKETLAKLGLQ
jgi:peptidoglycan hydrolase-like protein with peptidoglycan-binding domain